MSQQVRGRGLIFGNLVHAIEGDIPAHTHDASFYHLVLAGKYEESEDDDENDYDVCPQNFTPQTLWIRRTAFRAASFGGYFVA